MADYQQLYNSVKLQNAILLAQQVKMKNEYSTDAQIVKYKSDDIQYYRYINYYLRWVYYIVALAIIYVIMFGKHRGFSFGNIILVAFVFSYPFVMIPIETFVFSVLRYFYAFIFRNPFLQFQYDTPVFTLSSS